MGINGNIWELMGINRKLAKLQETGNFNVVENKILQHNLG